jgi:CDP-diacylglycerol--glycerol-3-phosphate 3-phosphatidyltransferase
VLDLACSLALVAIAVAVLVAYAARVNRKGFARDERVVRAGGSPLLAAGVQQAGYWALRPVARACIALGIGANAVSLGSLVLAAAAAVSFGLGHYGVGALVSVACTSCDAIDGMVARSTGTASDAGEVLDATVDRYVELLLLGGIGFGLRRDPLVLLLAMAAIAGSFMVSYATAKAEALHVAAPRGAMRRQERAAYVVLGAALVPPAAAAVSAWSLPAWIATAPIAGVLGLIAVVANASAVRRLRAVADVLATPRPRESHVTAGDPLH